MQRRPRLGAHPREVALDRVAGSVEQLQGGHAALPGTLLVGLELLLGEAHTREPLEPLERRLPGELLAMIQRYTLEDTPRGQPCYARMDRGSKGSGAYLFGTGNVAR
jgi:hypothetical protein